MKQSLPETDLAFHSEVALTLWVIFIQWPCGFVTVMLIQKGSLCVGSYKWEVQSGCWSYQELAMSCSNSISPYSPSTCGDDLQMTSV